MKLNKFNETNGSSLALSFTSKKSSFNRYQSRAAYFLIAPTLLLFVTFMVVPIAMAIYLSFTSYDIISEMKWVGLENFRRLISDEILWLTFKNVGVLTIFYVPLMIIISLLLAILVTKPYRGVTIFRLAFYMPTVTSAVAASIVWLWLLNAEYGLINQSLSYIGIAGPAWLAESGPAMTSVIAVTLWLGVGGNMIIYMAGLKGIPNQLYEAAKIDGASGFQQLIHITFPMLRPTTLLVSTMTIIGALQIFDQAYVLTQGGPANSTKTIVYHIYTTGFEQLQMGYASAQALVLTLTILIFTVINFKLNQSKD
ncbi:multiple sugar transport system permease protein [Gracilibacillus orientalis]|uniref:Multiple sugar transport system permease protein n=1 Tax=Gracilibacillus orientalis TaxID=334253 RepID=A0A1I4IUY0_9BACI|nr:sugar ABC transporter permease [Gracilibacillus orientalis]SFL58152.1 multiple sugar transport system permease protein [Gracilibacillus orientalis]